VFHKSKPQYTVNYKFNQSDTKNMPSEVVTRTFTADTRNQTQAQRQLDPLGHSASKLWNVGRHTIQRVWNQAGVIPDEDVLKEYLKTHERYEDLHSQSSQRVLEELSEAFNAWYKQDDHDANPPGYRKQGDKHPRSTITWKQQGIRLDTKNHRVRLSKGKNHKQYRSDYVLCNYQLHDPERSLEDIESLQQVRAVWTGSKWELHFVCKVELDTASVSSDKTAGVDLGICNTIAISYGDETQLLPANVLKEDAHYFRQVDYETENAPDGTPSEKKSWARHKKSRRAEHYYHILALDVVRECVKRNVGRLGIGHPKNVRDQDWGRHSNKRLHDWAFNRLLQHIEYKAEERGIDVERVDEAGLATSKTCCCCGDKNSSNRVERGLYKCESCGLVANADISAAENMRLAVTPSSSPGDRGWNRSNGCLAQPSVRLVSRESGRVAPRDVVV
jgi:putative transposase